MAKLFGKLNSYLVESEDEELKEDLAEAELEIRRSETEKLSNIVAKSVVEAFELAKKSTAKAVIILSPTGSGKTTRSAQEIAEHLRSNMPLQYVANQKSDMQQIQDMLLEITTEQERAKLQAISREHDAKIQDSTMVMLTHKTYMTRKGISNLHYSPLLWKKPDRTVILDEVQAYIQSQTVWISKGGRFFVKRFKDHTLPRKEAIVHCLVESERGNCSACTLCTKNYLHADANGIVSIRTYVEGKTGADNKPVEIPEVTIQSKIQYKTLMIEEIAQGPDIYRKRAYMCCRGPNSASASFEEIFADLLQSAFKPKRYTSTPISRVQEETVVNWKSIGLEFTQTTEHKSDQETTEIKRQIKRKYIFPKASCAVSIYEFRDRSSLSYLYENSKKLIMLGATLRADELEFIEDCCPNVQLIEIKDSLYKLDELAVIIYDQKFDFVEKSKGSRRVKTEAMSEALGEKRRILVFTPKKADTRDLYQEFPRGYPVAILNGEDMTINEKCEGTPYKIALTWSLGPLGTAINRPNDFVAFVESEIYLPVVAYHHGAEITKERIQEGYRIKAEDCLIQNGGRILRGQGRKVIILHNVAGIQPHFEKLQDAWAGMVKSPIQFLHVLESQDYLIMTATEYLSTGTFTKQTEPEYVAEHLSRKSKEEMSRTERQQFAEMSDVEKKEYYHKRQDDKQEKRLARLIEKGKELKVLGKSWGDIYKLLNLIRYKPLVDSIRQELGF